VITRLIVPSSGENSKRTDLTTSPRHFAKEPPHKGITPRIASLFDSLFHYHLRYVCILFYCTSTPVIAKSTANRETQVTSQALPKPFPELHRSPNFLLHLSSLLDPFIPRPLAHICHHLYSVLSLLVSNYNSDSFRGFRKEEQLCLYCDVEIVIPS
jgi:hypothetical protein